MYRGGNGGRGRGRGNRGRFSRGNNRRRHDPEYVIEQVGCAPSTSSVCIAIEGCCHGELDAIYERLSKHEAESGRKIDLLLCCGDFQSLRNTADFHSFAVPPKYRSLGSFYRYYRGDVVAPILTIFVGGNHEASQPLHELYYGGWVAPHIYYMGAAGVVRYKGIRIGGISGIYKSHDYSKGRFETPPYDRSSMRSIYHVRNVDVFRMKSLQRQQSTLDIMISHDWPVGIEQHGNTEQLLRQKPYFRQEVEQNCLGSPPNREILDALKPRWWFAAHLHVKFKATVRHSDKDAKSKRNDTPLIPTQVVKGATTPDSATTTTTTTQFHAVESTDPCAGPDLTDLMTQFLSLDKCLPRRHSLSILHIEPEEPIESADLQYDPEWLALLRKTHYLSSSTRENVSLPNKLIAVSEEEQNDIRSRLGDSLVIDPSFFSATVSAHAGPPAPLPRPLPQPLGQMGNPQTDRLLHRLDLDHRITIPFEPYHPVPHSTQQEEQPMDQNAVDKDEILLDDDCEATGLDENGDDNEIDLEDNDDAPTGSKKARVQ